MLRCWISRLQNIILKTVELKGNEFVANAVTVCINAFFVFVSRAFGAGDDEDLKSEN